MLYFDHILALSYSGNDISQRIWTLRGGFCWEEGGGSDAFLSPASSLTVHRQLACLLPSSGTQISQSLYTLSLPSFQPQLQSGFLCFCQVLSLGLLHFSTSSQPLSPESVHDPEY